MTPLPPPGAHPKPPAATPRAQGPPVVSGAPRPVLGSYGNLGTPLRIAPSTTPRVQAPPAARMPGAPMNPPRAVAGAAFPAARPRMPHAQGAPTAGVPRPMANLGGAQVRAAAPSPAPRMQMQAGIPTARAPGIPSNTRAVGPAVQSARPQVTMPLSQPTQRAPVVANPAAPSLGKRAPTTMGPATVPAAKRQAPMPRPQGAATATGGVPLPANPAAPAVGIRAPMPPPHAQGEPTGGNATPSRPPLQQPKLSFAGVHHDPSKGWMASVTDPKRRAARAIGPFDDPHLAALAHDRVAIACAGRGIGGAPRLNFETAFYRVETAFLRRWEGDVCDAIEKGEYEERYASFLKAGYKVALNVEEEDKGGEQITDSVDARADELITNCVGDGEFFWDDIEDFFILRAREIGEEALEDKGNRELLRNRFVEMHRNKSLRSDWRRENHIKKLKTIMNHNQQPQQVRMQQPQQQIQMQQPRQQIQIQQPRQQIQMQQPQQQQQIQIQQQQPQQIQMQQQQKQQQIQMQQQQQSQQQIIQKQRQQQTMMAQQQQQCVDGNAIVASKT